jgi:hypothetical protein
MLDELGEADGFDRSLLASAKADCASPGAEDRALAALGLAGVGVAVAAASSPGAAAAASSPGATSLAPAAMTTAKMSTAILVKWAAVGLVSLAAAAGAYRLAVPNAAPETTTSAAARAPQVEKAPIALPQKPSLAAPQEAVTVELDDDPVLAKPAAVPSPSSQAIAPAAGPSAAPALGAELAIIDRARHAIQAHDAASANAALDEYAKKFPKGALREEAQVARVETAMIDGDDATAIARADEFLRDHPNSVFVNRVLAIRRKAGQE